MTSVGFFDVFCLAALAVAAILVLPPGAPAQTSGGTLDMVGNFFSDNVHVVERWEFLNASTLNYRATIEDSTVYTRPWTIASTFVRGKRGQGEEYWEDSCHEGERSAEAMIIPAAAPTTVTSRPSR